MFKTETHLHTAPVSACGRFSPAHRTENIVRAAMLSETPVTSVQEYVSMLKNGEFRLMRNGEILRLFRGF